MSKPCVYLAGPAVFLPNAIEEGERLKAICVAHGLQGLFPLDSKLETDGLSPQQIAARIKHANMDMIRKSIAVIADYTPFRGSGMDAGTAFEVGFAEALGIPVFAYSEDRRDYRARVQHAQPTEVDAAGELRDTDGLLVEDFGLSENLMLAAGIEVFESAAEAIAAAGKPYTQ